MSRADNPTGDWPLLTAWSQGLVETPAWSQPPSVIPTPQPGPDSPQPEPSQARGGAAGNTLRTHLLGFSRTAGGRAGGGGAVKSSSMSFRDILFLHSSSASWRVILFSKPIRSNIERSVS